jgi:hypothetical protein
MQTRQQSILEVSLDFVLSILVNLYGQHLVYGTLATVGRMTSFAVVVLAASYARRMVTRRYFNAIVPHGQRQSRWHSVLETLSDTIAGFLITMGLQVLFYGTAATLVRAGGLTLAIYGLTLLRRYLLRRIFVHWEGSTASVGYQQA